MTPLHRRQFLQAGAAGAAGLALSAGPAPAAEGRLPKYKLGLVTYNTAAKWDLPTVLQVCKKVGLAAVELRTTHAHGVEPSLSKSQRQEVRQRFADSGIVAWGCGSVCEFHAPDQTVVRKNVETCKQFVELTADIGGRGVKVRPNGIPKDVPVEKTLAQIGAALAECGKAAADAGVEIWVEVHGNGSSHPPYVRTMMEQCGHKSVGITWNSNETDKKNGSVAEYFQLLRPWLKSCHINDLYKDMTGAYPYRELFALMRAADYDRVTLIEVGRTPPDVATGEEFLRYYKALWTELTRG